MERERDPREKRAPGMEGCPGCAAVINGLKPCEMNATWCCIAWYLSQSTRRPDRQVLGGDEGNAGELV